MASTVLFQAIIVVLLGVVTLLVYRSRLAPSFPPQRTSVTTTQPRTDTVYRLRGVPPDWTEDDLAAFLKSQYAGSEFAVGSLALEHHGRSKTATVNCAKGTSLPEHIKKTGAVSDEPSVVLTADKDFHGITTLFAPPPQDHQVNIVAISGLGGHAYGSFKSKSKTDPHMWLRDSLPSHLVGGQTGRPMARVMIYGYESTVAGSNSFSNIATFAQHFRQSLETVGSSRPLIFVAHSLGGLIVKEAIITLEQAKAEESRKLLQSIYGAVFFGVPHQGMVITSLLSMADNGPNLELLVSLNNVNSQFLTLQGRQFPEALQKGGHTEVFCFYETKKSPTAVQNKKTGKWSMSGPEEVAVSMFSATQCRPEENDEEHICGLSKGHSDLVKFGREDGDCAITLQKLKRFAKRALNGRDRLENSNAKFIIPYNENPSFVGRENLLEKVKEHFGFGMSSSKQTSNRLALYGLGGIGKTQIAISFAYWVYKMHHQISVFWIHASNEDRFRQSFRRIAEGFELPLDDPKEDVAALVHNFLVNQYSYKWIMIIDNADDKEIFFPSKADDNGRTPPGLKRYLPECMHGSILMTTRDERTGMEFLFGQSPLRIGELSDSEALEMVNHALGHEDTPMEESAALSDKLERLPLALAQALAYIKKNKISIDRYIQIVDKSDATVVELLSRHFEAIGRDTETPNAVTASWLLTFAQIELDDRLAAELLSLMSLFDRQAIPEELTRHRETQEAAALDDEGDPELSRIESLGTLEGYSFITRTADGTYDMHRLVQLVTRKWLLTKKLLDSFSSQAVWVLEETVPVVEWETLDEVSRFVPHVRAALSHPRAEKEQKDARLRRAWITLKIGNYFNWKEQLDDAERHAGQAHHIYNDILGPQHRDALNAAYSLFSIYTYQHRWTDARDRLEKLVELKVASADEDVMLRLERLLALCYQRQDPPRLEDALRMLLGIVEKMRKYWGEEHRETLTAKHRLAEVYLKQGLLIKAEASMMHVVEVETRLNGKDHPDTLDSLHTLARVYMAQGRFETAAKLVEELVETNERIRGKEHPDTSTFMHILVYNHSQQGNFGRAVAVAADLVALRTTVVGSNHPDTLGSLHNHAYCLYYLERKDEAIEMMHDCLSRRIAVLGAEHSLTRLSQGLLQDWEKEGQRG